MDSWYRPMDRWFGGSRWLEASSAHRKLLKEAEKGELMGKVREKGRKLGSYWGDQSVTFTTPEAPGLLRSLPGSDPAVRARKLTDVKFHHIAAYFTNEPGGVVAVEVTDDVPEGTVQLVYTVDVSGG